VFDASRFQQYLLLAVNLFGDLSVGNCIHWK
jgi:hypothetical protein